MNNQTLKKGQNVILTWGCFDEYECIVLKVLKYKIVIDAKIKNCRRILNDNIITLEKEYIRQYEIVETLPNIYNLRIENEAV